MRRKMEYWFDRDDRIAKVGSGWTEFATTNGAPDLTEESVRGLALPSFIQDRTTAFLWKILLQKARSGPPVSLTLRCDGPSRKRHLRVRVAADGKLIRVTTELLSEEERPETPFLAAARRSVGELLHCCSWCERFDAGGGNWVEIEELLRAKPLLESTDVPQVTHGICPACLRSALEKAGGGSATP